MIRIGIIAGGGELPLLVGKTDEEKEAEDQKKKQIEINIIKKTVNA